jgi:hypothetical protein
MAYAIDDQQLVGLGRSPGQEAPHKIRRPGFDARLPNSLQARPDWAFPGYGCKVADIVAEGGDSPAKPLGDFGGDSGLSASRAAGKGDC